MKHRMPLAGLFLVATLPFLFSGCGRKGALIPPEARVPAAIADLKTQQQGGRLIVSWTPPGKEVGGAAIREPLDYRLYRRDVLPPGQDCEECPSAYRLVKEVDADYAVAVRRAAGRLFIEDGDVAVGRTYQYKVIALRRDGAVSAPSNRARRPVLPPPPAPQLTAAASPGGVLLSWTAAAPPAAGTVTGYNIYRHPAGDPVPLLPLNSAPLTDLRYEDLRLQPKQTYRYGIRTVAETGGTAVESDLSPEVTGTLEELPSAP